LLGFVEGENGSVYSTYYASDYKILNGTYLSGNFPESVQAVDPDYLIIQSVVSGTTASAYYPSGYALGAGTTWISGSLSNLILDDGVCTAFRSYTHYDYDYHYAESNTVSSTMQTTWQDKVTLTFTSVADAYLIMASAELRGSSGLYDMEAQLTIDGTSYANLDTRPDETAEDLYSHHFVTFKAINLTAASHTFKIQYRSSSGFGTCSIKNARIVAFRIFDYALAEKEGSQSVSGGYADKVATTFNIQVAGEYIVIASAELNPTSTSYSVLARIGIDSTYQDGVSLEAEGVIDSWESYITHDIRSFDAGSHTVSIQASSELGTHFIRRARILAVRLTDYFLGWESGKSDDYTTNGSTSWADKLVVTFTPSAQCEYLILATARVSGDGTNGESYHSSFDFTLDGTEEGWWHGGISDNTDRITYATLKNSTLSETSHSLKLRYRSESLTNPDAGMGSARIIAIPMCGLKSVEVEFTGSSNTYTWAQLEWVINSAWTTVSVSVTLQLYNNSLGDYPASGNGYMSYISSATANTDETKSQNITVNPTHFRNATGYWKMKVKGVKAIETQFDFKADWIEFKPAYYSEYTVSTEFLFLGVTTKTPMQLNFTVVSQCSMTNVSITIQVWNYSSSAYATDGEAYLEYTSNGKNETKTLSINTFPQFYVLNGNAKLKITAMLATTQYQQEINQIKLLYSYSAMPPIASFTFVPDNPVINESIIFNASASYDEDGSIVSYRWDFGDGNITTVSVPTITHLYASHGAFTVNLTVIDNDGLADSKMKSIIVQEYPTADAQSFDWITALLYALSAAFGLLFILVLILNRKKKTKPGIEKKKDPFSKSFGMTRQQMIGKKILLEIDPTADYQNALFNFVSEAKNNGEMIFIFTSISSSLHSKFSEAENVKFFLLGSKTSFPQQVSEKETLLPASDLSVLLDTFARIQKVEIKKTINMLFDNLSDTILVCGFEKTYKFMRFLLETVSSPKATALFIFNPTAHDPATSSSIRGLFQTRLVYAKSGPKVGTL